MTTIHTLARPSRESAGRLTWLSARSASDVKTLAYVAVATGAVAMSTLVVGLGIITQS